MAGNGPDTPDQVARVRAMYRTMLTIRAFDEAAGQAHHDGHVRGSVHQYIGEEAIATVVCAHLRRADPITSYHRGHGHSIAKGADPVGMMKELFGRAGGTSGGKGGSMHIADFSVGMLGANGVVADGAPIAVGAAQAIKLRGEDRIVTCFVGDGALNRGPFLESLNWAKVYDLPVLFVCEDNGYAVTTKTRNVTAGPGAVARARSFDVRAVDVDGNDVVAVDAAVGELVRGVRVGEGPALLHASTYRLRGHLAHDPARYRDPAEVEAAAARDPLPRCERWLLDHDVSADVLHAMTVEVEEEIAGALEAAHAAPWPDVETAMQDVQDVDLPDREAPA